MYQNMSGPILKYWKNCCACSSSIGNKVWNSPLFRQKLVSLSRFSRPLIIIFSTKGFLKNNCSSILMHSTRSTINHMLSHGLAGRGRIGRSGRTAFVGTNNRRRSRPPACFSLYYQHSSAMLRHSSQSPLSVSFRNFTSADYKY